MNVPKAGSYYNLGQGGGYYVLLLGIREDKNNPGQLELRPN